MTVQLDEELDFFLQSEGPSVQETAREFIILELYRRHRISSGRAAELLGVARDAFIRHAGVLGIPYIDMTPSELEQDFRVA